MPKYEVKFDTVNKKYQIYENGRYTGKFYDTEEEAVAEMHRLEAEDKLKGKEHGNSKGPKPIKPPGKKNGGRGR
jgi:hypothetical protein